MPLSDMQVRYRFRLTFFIGYDSYVGEFVRALRDEGVVEFTYRFCSSGRSKSYATNKLCLECQDRY